MNLLILCDFNNQSIQVFIGSQPIARGLSLLVDWETNAEI